MPGLSFGKNEKKMGWQAQPTAQVIMADCRVPAANRIGPEGSGFKFAMMGLDGGRLNISACSLGAASEALERATLYSKDRKQFGKPIADFQATQFKLADMATDLEAGREQLLDITVELIEERGTAGLTVTEGLNNLGHAGLDCVIVLNDNGRSYAPTVSLLGESLVKLRINPAYRRHQQRIERIVRDLRVHQILEGTNEVMRVIIARELLKGS